MKNIQYKIFCCLVFCLGLGLASVEAQGVCDDPTIPVNDGWNNPPPNGDGFSVRQGIQSGRIFRNGVPSACPSKVCPGNFNPGVMYNWTAQLYENVSNMPVCITINTQGGACGPTFNAHGMAYQDQSVNPSTNQMPYDPANICTNYLGDAGATLQPFSVEVNPGFFEIVFTNANGLNNCNFTFTITGFPPGTIQTGSCTCELECVGLIENQTLPGECTAYTVVPSPTVPQCFEDLFNPPVVTTLLDENFDGCAQPAGWTTAIVSGAGAGTVTGCNGGTFSFQCVVDPFCCTAPPAGFSGCMATVDSDGDPSLSGVACIISPVMDLAAAGVTSVDLSFDWLNETFGINGQSFAEYWDGASWNQVWLATFDSSGSENISIAATNADFQVRFCYDTEAGTFLWGLAFDNVLIQAVAPNPNPINLVVVNNRDKIYANGDDASDDYPIGCTVVTHCLADGDADTLMIDPNTGGTICCNDTICVTYTVPTIGCSGNVQVSLDPTCQAEITPNTLLEPDACESQYIVTVFDGPNPNFANVLPTSPFVTINEIGQTLAVMVTSIDNNTSCWGTITIEDKTPPVVTCPPDFTLTCDSLAWFLAATPIPVGTLSATAAALPVNVVDNNTVSATTTILTGGTGTANSRIVDVNVNVGIDHSWVGDLDIDITSPAGTTVTLMSGLCGNEEQINATFDDEAAGPPQCATGNPTIFGSVTPSTALTAFDGEVPGAAWTLDVTDNVAGDQGYIHGFSVDMQVAALSGTPDVVEGCCLDNVWYEDDVDVNTCGTGTVTRTWYAVDCYKNEASCEQVITIVPNQAPGIIWPADIQHDCALTADQLTPADLEGDPNNPTDGIGFVFLGTADETWVDINTGRVYNNQFDPEFNYVRPRLTSDDYCGDFAFNYEDQLFDVCLPYGFKIRRTWTVLDWCNPGFEVSQIQIIKVVDDEAPVITCPTDKTISTSHTDCFAFLTPDPVFSTDNCDPSPQVVDIKYTDLNDIELPTTQVGPGTYRVKYTVSDACGNESACIQHITVVDNVPPVAICDANTNISLTAVNGWADLCATVINDQSYDNCGPIVLEIRAPNLPFPQNVFQPCVRFFCTNIGTHIVELRVWDDGNGNGLVGPNDPANFDADPTNDDNWNVCWANVTVEDKLPPSIICPADVTVDCTVDFTDPLFTGGFATGQDACSTPPVTWQDFGLTSCTGTFTRRWTASKEITLHDGSTITLTAACDQTITVVDNTPASVAFPSDITLDCPVVGTEPSDLAQYNTPSTFYDEPALTYDCENLGVSREDELFDICLPAGYKIRRTWHVIDWCDPNFDLTHIQVIKVQDIIQPEIQVNGIEGPDKNDPTSPPTHNLFVQIQNNDAACHEWVEIHATATDNCSASTISNNSPYSDTGSGYDASGYYPKGTHTFSFFAIDDCGNVREEIVVVTVVDAKAPQAQCLTQAVAIKTTGIATIDPADFDGGSFDNCTDQANLTFQLQLVDADDNPLDDPQNPLVLDCSHIGVNYVRLIVTDASNNSAYCVTTILLEDPNGVCGNVASLAVNALDQNGVSAKGDVMIDGGMVGALNPWTGSLPANQTYEVEVENLDCVKEGMSTIDIIRIRQHLLDKVPFTNAYQWLAADVDGNYKLSTIDIVQLRRLILDKANSLPNGNKSWRFVDADHVFTATNPLEQFDPQSPSYTNPEMISVDLNMAGANVDFVAVKVGDLTLDADPQCIPGSNRYEGSLNLQVDDAAIANGEEYVVEFKAKDFTDILGYQFTLTYDASVLEYVSVESGALEIGSENFGLTAGSITTSWDEVNGVSVSDEEVLFTMTFRAMSEVRLSEVLSATSDRTSAEAYSAVDGTMGVAIDFNGDNSGVTSSEFALYQNTPNPFAGVTKIGFNLPEAGAATLTVYDVSGRALHVVSGDYAKGYNAVEVRSADLNSAGVLYYELVSADYKATKKMIIIE